MCVSKCMASCDGDLHMMLSSTALVHCKLGVIVHSILFEIRSNVFSAQLRLPQHTEVHDPALRLWAEAAAKNCDSSNLRPTPQCGINVAESHPTPPLGYAPSARSTVHTAGSCVEAWAHGGKTCKPCDGGTAWKPQYPTGAVWLGLSGHFVRGAPSRPTSS